MKVLKEKEKEKTDAKKLLCIKRLSQGVYDKLRSKGKARQTANPTKAFILSDPIFPFHSIIIGIVIAA